MRFLFTGTSEGFHLSDEELWNIYGSRGQTDLLSNDNTQVIIYLFIYLLPKINTLQLFLNNVFFSYDSAGLFIIVTNIINLQIYNYTDIDLYW